MQRSISQFISILLLLAMSWGTAAGWAQTAYAEAAELEWAGEWMPEEGEDGTEDSFKLSGPDGEEEASKTSLSDIVPIPSSFAVSNYTTDERFFQLLYLAILTSFEQVHAELLSTPGQPFFILYCTYTSTLSMLA